jgi:hypothetical protein
MKQKTLCIIGNDKGGITKTSSIATVADGLETMNYSVRFFSGDKGSNLTLRKLYPNTVHYDVRDHPSMDKAMEEALNSDEDIVFFDFPGFSADLVREYFASRSFDTISNAGLRLVLAVVLTQHPEPISGGISWVETFLGVAEVMLIANGKDTPEGQPIDLAAIDGSNMLLQLAENRVVEIPRFAKDMLTAYHKFPAVPSDYHPGGQAYKALGMNIFSASPWKRHHASVVRSISPLAEWLTGKPIPKPFDTTVRTVDPKTNADLERLKAMYSPDAQFGQPGGEENPGGGDIGKTPAGKPKGRTE